MEPEQLILLVTASFASSVGFGDVYKCQVMHVVLGNLDDQEIMVTILAGDKVNSAFLATHLEIVAIEMGCKQRAVNEPYALMPISGFVDKNKTSWDIEYLKVSPLC